MNRSGEVVQRYTAKRLHGEVWAMRFSDGWHYTWALHPQGRHAYQGPFASEEGAVAHAAANGYDVGSTK